MIFGVVKGFFHGQFMSILKPTIWEKRVLLTSTYHRVCQQPWQRPTYHCFRTRTPRPQKHRSKDEGKVYNIPQQRGRLLRVGGLFATCCNPWIKTMPKVDHVFQASG